MTFRISGLDPAPFLHLYGLSDSQLKAAGAQRYAVDSNPGFPDRIEMRDLEIGESAILLNYMHQPAHTPYRASHAIFVREGADKAYVATSEIPAVIRVRQISLRAFSDAGDMVDAELADGREVEQIIERFFVNPAVAYIQAHYAKRGCYAARIDRA